MKDKDSFWFSKLQCAQTCLHKYELSYVKDIASCSPPSIDITFGSAIHLAIETMFAGEDYELTFSTYWDSLDQKIYVYKRLSHDELRAMGLKMLSRFHRLHFKHFKPALFEHRLYATTSDQFKVEGTLDNYGQYKDVLSIIDYKTSGQRYDKHKLDVAEQLIFYAYLLVANGYELPKQIVYVVFIKTKQKGVIAPSIQVIKKDLTTDVVTSIMKNCSEVMADLKTRNVFFKNYSACLNYNSLCAYWDRCHGVKKDV